MSYRRTRVLLHERKEIAKLRNTRCRFHRTTDCRDERCRHHALRPPEVRHNNPGGNGVNTDAGSRYYYSDHLENLFRLIRSPRVHVEENQEAA